MINIPKPNFSEGNRLIRLFLVLSGMSPVFILWAIRGSTLVSQPLFLAFCAAFAIVPNIVVWEVYRHTKLVRRERQVVVGSYRDRRDDVITYLFAMLLPFYAADLDSTRNLYATLAAFVLVVFLFWILNLHHLNLLVVAFGYHCYEVTSPTTNTAVVRMESYTLLSKASAFQSGARLRVLQITNTVFLHEVMKIAEAPVEKPHDPGSDDEF